MLSKNVTDRLAVLSPHFTQTTIHIAWCSASYMNGEHASSAPGAGLTYCDFKPYRPGDNPRQINWKMLARRPDRPVITQFEEDRRITVAVLVDVGPSMKFGTQELLKDELAVVLTASILKSVLVSDVAYFAAYTGSKLGCRVQEKPAREVLRPAYKALLEDPALTQAKKSSGLATALSGLPQERSLVFVVSDFFNLTDDERKALRSAAKKHEVVCLVVQDERERELPDLRLSRWLPVPMFCEACDFTGGSRLLLPTMKVRDRYRQDFVAHENALTAFFTESRLRHATFSTEEASGARKKRLGQLLSGKREKLNLNRPVAMVAAAGVQPTNA